MQSGVVEPYVARPPGGRFRLIIFSLPNFWFHCIKSMIEFFNNNFFKVRLSIYSIQYNNLFSIIIIICAILLLQGSFHLNSIQCMGNYLDVPENLDENYESAPKAPPFPNCDIPSMLQGNYLNVPENLDEDYESAPKAPLFPNCDIPSMPPLKNNPEISENPFERESIALIKLTLAIVGLILIFQYNSH